MEFFGVHTPAKGKINGRHIRSVQTDIKTADPGGEHLVPAHAPQKEHLREVDRSRFKALCGEVVIAGRRGLVMKPQTYMNASGEAVREAADFYKISPENIYVICDDISLAPGRVRLRKKGSDGGQKGLRSIIYQLGSDDFPRIRVGVGEKPRPDYDLADWVLGTFPESDKTAVFEALGRICDTLPTLIGGDTDKAMNILNTAAK